MNRIIITSVSILALIGCSSAEPIESTTQANVQTITLDEVIESVESNTQTEDSAISTDESAEQPDAPTMDIENISGANDNYDLPADSGTTPAPQGISIAVYSDTAAELNWVRPLYRDGITTNEIWRDGQLLATIPGGGNSYVDDDRTPQLTYVYHIVANSQHGRATARFVEYNGTVANPWSPVITTAEIAQPLRSKLDATMNLIQGTALQKLNAFANKIDTSVPEELGLTFIEVNRYNESVYSCSNGGTIEISRAAHDRGFDAKDCSIAAFIVNGRTFQSNDKNSNKRRTFVATRLLDTRDNSAIWVYLSNINFEGQTNKIKSFETKKLDVTGPQVNYAATRIEVSRGEASHELNDGAPGFNVSGYGIEGALGNISRLRNMSQFDLNVNGRPTIGALAFNSMNVGDETYGINANNENPDTFTLNATINGTLTSYDVSWSETNNFASANIEDIYLGF